VLGRTGGDETRRETMMTTTHEPEYFEPIVESLVKLDISDEELRDALEVASLADLAEAQRYLLQLRRWHRQRLRQLARIIDEDEGL
jgi:hypothetical protein